MAICAKWDVIASDIGVVTDGTNLVITTAARRSSTPAEPSPTRARPTTARTPPGVAGRAAGGPGAGRPSSSDELRKTVLDLAACRRCARAHITEQYDRYVRCNTVGAKHADAGVLRVNEETGRGVAISTDASGRYTKLDPRTGVRLALAEAHRNVSVTGAMPYAVSNCLNFGSPENPDAMWQFAEAVRGLADGAAELDVPVTGGNVSFYNQTGDEPILPTPVIAVLGIVEDVEKVIGNRLAQDGADDEVLYLLGDTADELGGSIWQQVAHDALGGMPPAIDLADEDKLTQFFHGTIESRGEHFATAARDLSEAACRRPSSRPRSSRRRHRDFA